MKNAEFFGSALLTVVLSCFVAPARAEESVSPYIDSIRQELGHDSHAQPERTHENPQPYIDSIRKNLEPPAEAHENGSLSPYIDRVRQKDPSLNAAPPRDAKFVEEEKLRLGPATEGGAIQAVRDGHSELLLKRPGSITTSMGFKMGADLSHQFTGDPSVVANSFSSIYTNGWVPDFTLFAEYKPFHSEIWGALGIVGSGGFAIFKGHGVFDLTTLTRPDGTTPFGTQSQTKLTFISIPVSLQLKYEFTVGHYLRPYGQFGPTVVGVSENRNDGIGASKAISKGVLGSAGVEILLDGLSASNSWNLYQDFGVKHFYLTIEYTKLTTLSSPVDVSYSGAVAGFAFDL